MFKPNKGNQGKTKINNMKKNDYCFFETNYDLYYNRLKDNNLKLYGLWNIKSSSRSQQSNLTQSN